jgi:hypothetical protein
MLKLRYGEDLSAEAFRRDRGGELRRQNLDDDFPLESVILAHEHDRHASASELTLNGVGSAQGGDESFGDRGHRIQLKRANRLATLIR